MIPAFPEVETMLIEFIASDLLYRQSVYRERCRAKNFISSVVLAKFYVPIPMYNSVVDDVTSLHLSSKHF